MKLAEISLSLRLQLLFPMCSKLICNENVVVAVCQANVPTAQLYKTYDTNVKIQIENFVYGRAFLIT